MGYDFTPKNEDAGRFHLGAFSFPVLLEACGHLWPSIHHKGQWYCVWGADPRMPEGDTYPGLISNDGFEVTEEEAHIMARMARNLVLIQRSLPDDHVVDDLRSKNSMNREDVIKALERGMYGGGHEKWPVKIRPDFMDKFEQFAEWLDKSGGFVIW